MRLGAALLLLLCAALPAPAEDYRAGDMIVTQPWSRPTPPAVAVGAVYFSISNLGSKADRLLGLSSPIAGKVEVHESRVAQGTVEMRPVTFVECAPGSTVKSEPGGLHVMLLGLARPLEAGMRFPITLHFRDAGLVTAEVRVGARQ